jgi:hypothetical protein
MANTGIERLRADLDAPLQEAGKRRNECQTAPCTLSPAVQNEATLAHYVTRAREKIGPFFFGAVLITFLVVVWLHRDDGELTPESGLGYWLGIIGSSAMLLLLIYPFRKRLKLLRAIGGVTFWFRTHMVLGLVGPALILTHSNFQLGATNSNVALFSMLIVAGSGLVGKYLYRQIHLGLYGRKAALRDILADVDLLQRRLGEGLPKSDRIIAELNAFAHFAMVPQISVLSNLWSMLILKLRAGAARRRLSAEARQLIKIEGKRQRWSKRIRRERIITATGQITLLLAGVKKAAAFAFYERLFALWHVLHLPMFFLMVLAAIVHVFAVHFY